MDKINIDGVDISARYGIYFLRGGNKSVVNPPKLKPFPVVDWKDRDGLDYDTSAPLFEERKITVNLYAKSKELYVEFINYIYSTSCKVWNFEGVGYSLFLRLISQGEVKVFCQGYSFSLVLSEDTPFAWYVYQPPVAIHEQQGLSIDNKDLSYYGIKLLRGCDADLAKAFTIKENIKINSKYTNGIKYPNNRLVKGTKTIKIHCLLRGEVLRNMNACFSDMSASGYRYLKYNERQFNCLLKGFEIADFDYTIKWLKLNINIEIIKEL